MKEQKNTPECSLERRELLKLLLTEESETGARASIPRVDRNGEPLEASFGQERLWFFDQLAPGNPLFNQSATLRLEGRLQVTALRQAFQTLVRRHEVLRTSFRTADGRPMQMISADMDVPLPTVDLSHLSQAAQQAELRQRLEFESRQPFALDHTPLWRSTLLRLGPELHVLLIATHHIISDGWSHDVMQRELVAWYRFFAHGQGEPLPELPLQYADYAAWQRRQLNSPLWQEQVAYWKLKLGGELPALELPLDHPRRPGVSFRRAARLNFAISPQVRTGLRELSRAEKVTQFVTLLTAFKALLHRYTGQEDLLVASPIAVRSRLELEGLIGFFVNTLALRTDLAGEPTFSEALHRVQRVCLEAYAHQDLPFEKVVAELQTDRFRGDQPLTPVSFMLHKALTERQELGSGLSLVVEDMDLNDESALTMVMWEAPEALTGTVRYDPSLFEAATIERLVGHWQALLAGIVADPKRRVADLPLLEETERQQLLFGWNDPHAEYRQSACLHERFEQQVEATPEAPAVTCDGRQLTYCELNRQANQLAHYLRARGVGPDVPVALCTDRSVEMVIGVLGIAKAGGTYVPLDSDYPQARLDFMLRDSRSRVLVTQHPLRSKLPEDGPPVVLIDADWSLISQESEENPANRTAVDNVAYVIYTSGSTGRPKGTVVSHASVGRLFDATEPWFHFGPTDVWTMFHSLAFDFSVWELWGSLLYGGRLVVVPYFVSRSPLSFYDLLHEQRVTVLNQTPSAFRQLVQHEETLPSNLPLALRLVIFGGEALDMKSLAPWFDRHGDRQPQLVNMYGITETTVHVTYRPLTAEAATTHRSVIGRPIPDLQVYLLDERLQPVPVGIPGELHVGGAGLSRGYLGRPELSAERFIPDPFGKPGSRLYRSGDVARRLPDGDIEYLGRIDHQVKIRGFRIELSEIEAVLAECSAVREGVVVAREDRPGEKRLVAYVVRHEEPSDSAAVIQDLRDHLKRRVPDYMVPAAFMLLDRLPLSSNGKLDRHALPAPEFAGAESRPTYVPPRNAVEQHVAGIWADVLAVDRVGVHDNFFELGGHSLLATQVISRTCHLFRVEIPLRSLFEAPTVGSLAETIEEALRGNLGLSIPPLQRMERVGPLPLSFAQQRLWFLDRLAPGNPFYNMSGVVRLTGHLDLDALERSFNEIVRRHEALRTTFVAVQGQPVQEIASNLTVPFPFQDLQALPEAKREAEAVRLAREEARRPFDLARGPLLRARVLRLATEEHVLLLSMHHIVSDGWSVGVLVREMMALYEAFSQGRPSPLGELPIQYVDFAIWQRRWLTGEVLDGQLSYWKKQLTDPPTLELPTDRPRPAIQTFRGETVPFDLPAVLTEELRKLSRREGVTLFMTMLAAFNALLFRWTDQEDTLVGSPIANRNRGETEGLIGFFVNMLVLRTNLSGNPGFLELLGRVREVALEAYAHQDLPFERLVEELQPLRDPSRNPLFQVALALQNAPMPELKSGDVTLRILEAGSRTTKFDVTMFLWETAGGLAGTVEYSSDLFDASTITRLLGHFTTLLQGIVTHPEQRLGDLPVLPAAERQQVLETWNATGTGQGRRGCVHHLVEQQAEVQPGATAVACGGLQLTYRELNDRANGLATALQQKGVGPEVVVGLYMERSLELIVGMLAILKAGGAYLALDPSQPKARLTFLLEDSRASVLLTQESLLATLPEFPRGCVCVLEEAEVSSPSPPPPTTATESNLAYVIYTSGSTGQPKGVAVSHGSLLNLIDWHRFTYEVSPADRASQLASLSFDASVWEIWPYIACGASLHLVEESMRRDPERLLQWLAEERITLAFVPTPLAEVLLTGGAWPAKLCLRAMLTGGDVLHQPPRSPIPFALVNHYGPTENTVVTTWVSVKPDPVPQAAPPPIGRPVSNTQVYLLDRWGQPVPIGVTGELFIGGESLARGYLHRPDLTAERFLPDPFSSLEGARLYASGDLARWTSQGVLEFMGRRDHQVKIRGFRIELGEVEAVLHQHPDVESAAVLACEDASGSKRLVGYVVPHSVAPSERKPADAEHVRQWQILYDETYKKPPPHSDPSFNTIGWNSSYTGLPLPESAMREWVEQTVARIVALRPRRILEIGCGTGLLLFRLAPRCEHYVGTDFSAAALEYLRPHVAALSRVKLLQRMAHELDGLEPGSFDVIVLNSVVQYFPGIDYLGRVLEAAAGMLRPGGSIFVGDVRSLPLLESFHATTQLHQAPAAFSREQFLQRLQQHIKQEGELVIDPAFFFALQDHLSLGRVDIWPKRGRESNELTQFRYDVTLHLAAAPSAPPPVWQLWAVDALSLGALRELLQQRQPEILALSEVPNTRLGAARRALAWMAGETELRNLGELRTVLAEQRGTDGLDPDELWTLGEELAYRVDVSWSRGGAAGSFDLLLTRAGSGVEHSIPSPVSVHSEPQSWSLYANDPLRAQKSRMLPATLRRHAEQLLPEHMVPSVFVVLESFPQTPSGKVDRHALPSPDLSEVQSSSTYVPPRNEIERQVAEIWAELLAVERVGVYDNFFELGGHSLLATQLVSRVRQYLDVALPVRVVFDEQTVSGIAESIGAILGKPSDAALRIPLAPRQGGPALSFVQERVWISNQLVQAGATGSIGGAIWIHGPLDETALRRSIEEIVDRHEVLRTTFQKLEDRVVLSVEELVEQVWSTRDLRGVADGVRRAEALMVARQEADRGFELSTGPLLRVTLVRVGEAESLLVMTTHHVAFDGWSVGVFFRELEVLYGAHSRGEASPLAPLPIQYADYAAWQRAWSQGPELQEQLAYWKSRLGGRLPALELPLDHPRSSERTWRGATQKWTLPTEVTRALAELSRQEGVTLFMTLLAGFQALLNGATGQEDIALGSPVASRNRVEMEGLIGCFMQPLVLRTDLSGDPAFRELLGRVREVCLGAYAHQEVPFERVLRALHPRWDGSQLPLFQVLFNMQREEPLELRLPGLTLNPVEFESTTSSLDLSVHLLVDGTEIRGFVEYSTELFEASTIEWLGTRYRALLAAAVAGPDRRLSELWRANPSPSHASGDLPGAGEALSPERRELLALLLAEKQASAPAADLIRQPRTGGPYPASCGQERLWFFEKLEPGTSLFNECAALRFEGPLDADVLERSWQELAHRHESFRTSFVDDNGSLKQVIASRVKVPMLRLDLAKRSEEEQQEHLRELLEQEVEKPFDLAQAPLLRLVLLRFGPEQHALVVAAHHIIADGWSAEVWQSDLAAVYDAFVNGRPSPLPELAVQYVDYAAWQRERLRGPWVHEELAYWKRQLGGELPVLELPVDRKRATGSRRERGATHAFEISERVHQKLRELGKREGATLFMTLVAAFQALLHRYTGQEDILVDTVTAGRSRAELSRLVGFFVNSVILRTDLSGNPTFRALLGRVKRVCLEALEHQEVPFDRVVAELTERKGNRGLLTPVSIMLHEAVTKHREMGGGVRLSPAPYQINDEFDLTLFLWQESEGLKGQLKYDRELFDRETIEQMARHFVSLLEVVAAEPEVRLGEIAILTERERWELVHGWNQTREEIGEWQCVHERFEARARENAEAIAVRLSQKMREEGKEHELSYGELERRANQLARYLRKQGVKTETLVGLCLGRSLELAVGMLGILKSGGAYVPLDSSQPRGRLKKLIEDSGLTVVVTRMSDRRDLGDLLAGLTVVEVEESREESGSRFEAGVSGQNAAYVIHTSGSTGEPKGVVVSHASVVNHSVAVTRRFGLGAADRVLQFHTASFDAAVEEMFPTWGVGAVVVMRGEELVSPGDELENLIADEQLTVANLPTAYWHEWVANGERRKRISASGLRLVVVGGDKVNAEIYTKWRELTGGRIRWLNTYGPTETTVISSLYEPESEAPGEVSGGVSIGRPIGNTRMYVLDGRMQPVPVGVAGELWIGGEGLARGYLGRPDLTAERFVPDPLVGEGGARMYRTGDRVRYRRDGRLEFLGRVDEQVKVRGFRVEPAEIESALFKHPRVSTAVVIGRKVSEAETGLVAYVVDKVAESAVFEVGIHDRSQVSLVSQLRSYLQGVLPDYMVPSAIVLLDSIPMTASGKVNRRRLPEPEPLLLERAGYIVPPQTELERTIAAIWQDVLGLPQVGLHDNFFDLGGHSLLLTRVQSKLASALGRDLPMVELFHHTTIHSLARFLSQDEVAPLKLEAVATRARRQRRAQAGTEVVGDAVAIVGMSGRFPGAPDIAAFWQTVRDGVEAITFFTDEELVAAGVASALVARPDYVKAAALLKDVELFDASFFGYSPREAEIMDPQHRFFLECAWEALEDAGYDPARYPGHIGVFAGQSASQYLMHNLATRSDLLGVVSPFQAMISNDKDFLATTVSYKLGLTGPSVSVQTACSTSLVAVCFACQSLLNNQCDMALAGGVSISSSQKSGYLYQEGHIMSPDGHCRAFDGRAQGTIGGSGIGTVVLKRLSDAVADGDAIHAVIRGFAVNNDGSMKVGYTAPSVGGQAEVIAMAQAMAQVDPETITYVEAHGTGTALGDPIEIAALTQAFRASTAKQQFCAITSLKTNIGHLDAAAGVAGLIKTVLALKHKQLPPSLHYESPNPQIDFASSPFYVNTKLTEWAVTGAPRRAGVSSFGIGGTNAHVVVEEAPAAEAPEPSRPWQLVVLSGRTATARERQSELLAAQLAADPDQSLADVAYTLQIGRRAFAHRLAVVCREKGEAIVALGGLESRANRESGRAKPQGRTITGKAEERERPVAFMFPGQGTQYVNMGRELYETEHAFREPVDRCCELLQPHLGCDLRAVLYPTVTEEDAATEALRQTALTQPALFVVEYALSRLWLEWGVRPAAMVGHSIGEYVAAHLSGVFSLEDALRLVAARGRLIQELPAGAMLAVSESEDKIHPLLSSNLSLAAVNGPELCVVSGPEVAVAAFERLAEQKKIGVRRLATSHAFHSEMMEPILSTFAAELRQIKLHAPQIPYLSNVTGTWITADEAMDPAYWVRHLRATVRFGDEVAALLKAEAPWALLEVGPGHTLSILAKQQAELVQGRVIATTLRHPREREADGEHLLKCLAQLWVSGVAIDWEGFYRRETRRRTQLPVYPFERKRYWVEPGHAPSAEKAYASPLSKKPDIADWFYVPSWIRAPWPASAEPDTTLAGSWLMFIDECGLGPRLAESVEAGGGRVVTVTPGPGFVRLGAHSYVLHPSRRQDYARLLGDLRERKALPQRIVHLWNVTSPDEPLVASDRIDAALDRSFYSLLALAQAIGDVGLTDAVKLTVISNGLQQVTGEETVRPEKAALLGPVKVIPLECPEITCTSVDVVLPAFGARQEEPLLERLVDELTAAKPRAASGNSIVAYDRRSQRWERSIVPVRWTGPTSGRMPVREGGAYLITGGTSGIGLALARSLAERVRVKLVLTGRSALPPREVWAEWLVSHPREERVSERIRNVQELEGLGAEVLVVSADVSDAVQMRAAVNVAKERFGTIHGVIHSAGIAGHWMIQLRDPRVASEVLAPKVKGTLILAELFTDTQLDFLINCSSLASELGGFGQIDYCAANAFMNAFAQAQSASGGIPTVTIDWDTWQEVGMAATAEIPPGMEAMHREALELGIKTREGMEAFGRILDNPRPQVLVSTRDFAARLKQAVSTASFDADLAGVGVRTGMPLHPRPELSNEYVAPRGEVEEKIAGVWEELLGVQGIGIHDSFFDLGGHSLLATQLVARVRQSFDVTLPMRMLFDSPTVAGMAEAVESKLSRGGIELPRLRPMPRDGGVPLSYAQEGLWFIDQLQPGTPFNIPVAIRLEGPLDIAALQSAANAIVARHEVLRTTFGDVDGQPIQVVAASQPVSITTVAIHGEDDTERRSELLKQVVEEARRPFDLSRGPLLRMMVFQLSADDHVMMFTVHHSVFDGWSVALFAHELNSYYAAFTSGTEAALSDLRVQYADYAAWQREVLQGEFLESQLGYWTKRLAQYPTGLSLPTDRSESTSRLFHGGVASLRLSRTLSEALRTICRNEESTMFMVLLAAFKSLLARYSGQDDIVVGTPVANRSQPEQENLIGFCVNLVALRTDLSGNPSFRQLIHRVRETCLGAYSHQDLPFGLLVQRIHPDRDITRSPLFQVQFALQTAQNEFRLPGLQVSSLADDGLLSQELRDLMVEASPATDHLFLQATDLGAEITADMQYRADLFDADTIQRMMRHLQVLLEGFVADPDRPVFETPMLEPAELRQLLMDRNPMPHPGPRGIGVHHLFEAEAERVPEAVAVIVPAPGSSRTGEERLTYRQLNQRANQLAWVLQSQGAGPEVRVGICLERSPEMIVAVLGVLKAGAAYVPLDPTYPDERLQYMFADAQIRLLVTRKGLIAGPVAGGVQTIELDSWREALAEAGEANPSVAVEDEHLAYVVYTSGSTGRPKGVMVSHRSVVNAYRAWEDAYDLRTTRCHLQMASFSFDVFTGDWTRALCSGGALVLCPHESLLMPEDLCWLLRTYEVDCAEFVPAVVRPLIEHLGQSGQTLDFMNRIIIGSDSWSCREYEQVRRVAGAFPRVTNSYGVAEATIDSTYLESMPGDRSGDEPVPIGHPFANTQVYVLDQRLQPVPVGVAGELYVGGAGLARGYLNRPDLTAEKFIPNPFSSQTGERLYRTGDRARLLVEGNIELLGRVDEQIKIRGFRVEVGEIEALLSEHPAVREAVVVGRAEHGGEKRVVAYAVLHAEADVNPSQLREFLERRLPHYMVPSAVIVLDNFPLTPNGKVDRRALPAPTGQRRELAETYVAPRSPVEVELAQIWSQELRVDQVGIHHDFFALGGHSLLAARVMSRVRKTLKVDLSLREMFLHPTVAGLAEAVELALTAGVGVPIDDLDLEREAELDPSITIQGASLQFPAEPARVLLTGATGFVGSFLLRELLTKTNADVYCLVRSASADDGLRRLRHALEKYGLWEDATSTRIVPVVGDLSKPKLGLSDEQYSDLGRSIDLIYHNGAVVNDIYPYAMLKPVNVLGTQEVLRLACDTKTKPVHYVSTISVFPHEHMASGWIDEVWTVDGGNSLRGGYPQSKWVAERLVLIAAERGLPVAIYRPGRVSGDSRTGVWLDNHQLIHSLQTVFELGSVPRVGSDVPIELVPVDYVAQAIVCLSRQPESLGRAFHVVNPQPIPWWGFIERLADLGFPLQELETEHWLAGLVQLSQSAPSSFLSGILSLLPRDRLAGLTNMAQMAAEAEDVPDSTDTVLSARETGSRSVQLHINCTNTLHGLKGSQVTCRPVGELLDLYLSYFVRSGVLRARNETT